MNMNLVPFSFHTVSSGRIQSFIGKHGATLRTTVKTMVAVRVPIIVVETSL